MVTWGYNADTTLTFDLLPGVTPCSAIFHQDGVRAAVDAWPERDVDGRVFPNLRSLGTACYSVSPRGAARLLGFCLPLRPMRTLHPGVEDLLPNTGIDNMMASLWPEMRAFVAVPPLVLTPNEASTSTVQAPAAASRPSWSAPGGASGAVTAGSAPSPSEAGDDRPAVRSFDLFDTLIARRCVLPEAVFAEVEEGCGVPGFAAARMAAERELHGGEYDLDAVMERLRLRTGWTAERVGLLREAELEAEWRNAVPVAETVARVGPSDLVVSDMYLPRPFVERLLRETAGLPFSTLVLSAGGKSGGGIWPELQRSFSIIEHQGDNAHSDGASPMAAGIPAVVSRPTDPTPIEQVLSGVGLVRLSRAVRVARLATFDADDGHRLLQRAQVEANAPLLVLGCVHLAREMAAHGLTRALVSGRDGHKMQQVLARLFAATGASAPSCEYFLTSRVARATASPGYRRYVSGLMRGERSVIVDLCGTGWSLMRLLDRMGGAEGEAAIYLLHHMDASPLWDEYRRLGAVAPRPVLSAVRGEGLPNNRLELLNLTDHAMLRDVGEVMGHPVPLFLDDGHDAATRPLVRVADAAFAAILAELDEATLREAAALAPDVLVAVIEALYRQIGALPERLFRPLLRQQGREEGFVRSALLQAADPVPAGAEALPA